MKVSFKALGNDLLSFANVVRGGKVNTPWMKVFFKREETSGSPRGSPTDLGVMTDQQFHPRGSAPSTVNYDGS